VLVNLATAEQGHGGGEWDGAGLSVAARVVLARWGLRFVWKVGALATSLFLMVCTGALVAFALAEGQARLVQLSGELRWVLRSRLPYTGVVLRYALDGLVFVPIVTGILFFLFEVRLWGRGGRTWPHPCRCARGAVVGVPTGVAPGCGRRLRWQRRLDGGATR